MRGEFLEPLGKQAFGNAIDAVVKLAKARLALRRGDDDGDAPTPANNLKELLEARALVAVEEREVGGYRVNRVFPEGELSGEQLITHVDDIVGEPVSRVIVRDPEATADDFIELAANLGLHGTDYVVGWTAWLDLSPVGVSKASGLQHVCDKIGLTAADVLAIGDGRNDIEMLSWAGRGVAMGQAPAEVAAAADDVTDTIDRGGLIKELQRWF